MVLSTLSAGCLAGWLWPLPVRFRGQPGPAEAKRVEQFAWKGSVGLVFSLVAVVLCVSVCLKTSCSRRRNYVLPSGNSRRRNYIFPSGNIPDDV